MTSCLRSGVIVEVAAAAGIEVRRSDKKCAIHCPFHEDGNPSAFLDPKTNVFFCAVCTPAGGWSAKRFAEAIGVSWPHANAYLDPTKPRRATAPDSRATFTAADAQHVWDLSLARARDDERAEEHRVVYDYVCARGLADAWEDGLFGVLPPDSVSLPATIARWSASGHRLVARLFDGETGRIANVQGRTVTASEPKTLFPAGSKARGTLFASTTGIAVLQRSWSGPKAAILGEGLTDFLALASISPVPVLAAPGTGFATSGIGPWVSGLDLYVALDADDAGRSALGPTADAAYFHGASRVRQIEWPRGCKDACDLVQRDGLVRLAAFLTRCLGGFS